MAQGEASEPRRRAQPQGCRGQSGEIPAQRISANQHPPVWEACLLTCQGEWGLGAEAPALEVRSQGEDWGWLHEPSLKGASAPQLAGRESRKKSGPAEEARDHFLRCVRRGDSFPVCPQNAEHHLNELQRRMWATAIISDPRDGHETLTLLLQPPRILCASRGHIHTSPPGSLCSPPLPGSRDPGTSSRGEHTVHLRLFQRHTGLCCCRFAPHSNYNYRTPPSPQPEWTRA